MEKRIREILEREFEPSQVKQRKGSYGKMLDYVDGHAVLTRLAEAFDGDFSFRVIEWSVREDEVIVLGELAACGLVKQAFGSKKHNAGDEWGDTAKSATTDALKAAAKQYGVALHLYGDAPAAPATTATEEKAEPKQEEPAAPKATSNQATNAQVRAVISLSKRNNLSTKDLAALLKEVGGVEKVEELDRRACSTVIQRLQTMAA